MENVIEAVKQIMNLDKVNMKVIGMRPGEKFHEDMLAKTELDFTYQVSDKLLTVLPQYTRRNHTHNNPYKGLEFNSSLHNNDNISDLVKIIEKGIEDAN